MAIQNGNVPLWRKLFAAVAPSFYRLDCQRTSLADTQLELRVGTRILSPNVDYRRARFCGHAGWIKLFLFGGLMLVRLADGTLYLGKKRVAARWGGYIA